MMMISGDVPESLLVFSGTPEQGPSVRGGQVRDYSHFSLSLFGHFHLALTPLFLARFGLLYYLKVQLMECTLKTMNFGMKNSLIRAAFELGNSTSPTLGVDPQKDADTNSKFQLVIRLLMYV